MLRLLLFPLFFVSFGHSETLYTDTWVNWTASGKVYDIVCFSKKEVSAILKGVRVLALNRKAFQYKDSDGELKALATKDCFFEQLDPHPVSRQEFFEEIVSVKCSLNNLPFKDGDFRVLGTNINITSIKRLRDGKIWILPTNDCTFTTQLEKKTMVEAKETSPPVQIYSEFTFPGESDQVQTQKASMVKSKKEEPKGNISDSSEPKNDVKKEATTAIRNLLNQEP